MPADAAPPSLSVSDLQRRIEMLEAELRARTTERDEASIQQTATAEVLQVINGSRGDLQPVFDAMLERAVRLTDSAFGTMNVHKDGRFQPVALHRVPDGLRELWTTAPPRPGPHDLLTRLVKGEDAIHVEDLSAYQAYREGDPRTRGMVDLGGARTLMVVALRKDSGLMGSITTFRQEVRPFTDKQIALLQSFAVQAVIAIENARLLEELRQRQAELARSVDELTAITDVLKIISRSPSHLQPVLDTIANCAVRLCGASMGAVYRFDGELVHLAAHHNYPLEALSHLQKMYPRPPQTDQVSGRAILTRAVSQIEDSQLDPLYRRELAIAGGWRSQLAVPMLRDGEPYGAIVIARSEAGRFLDAHIEVLKTFADQAVIAIENTRLFEEVRDRQAELRVTFDNMGDGVAMFDAELRLAAWNRNFEQIIGLPEALLAERPSYADYLRMLAERGEFGTENVEAELASRLENMDRELRLERTRADGTVIEVRRNAVPDGGFVLIYSDVTEQRRAEAEIRAARDAAEAALERQTATADILKVIASSPTDVQPVLDAVAKAAQRFCGAVDALISLRDDDEIIRAAHEGSLTSALGRIRLDRSSISGQTITDARTIHIPDIGMLDHDELATTQALAADSGARAAVAAPMLREGVAVGSILLRKAKAGPFTPQQIGLLETFAAQAVIAIENVRLFTGLRESLEQQTATSEILHAISQSPTDVQPVLDAVVKATLRFCGATDAVIILREGDGAVFAAHEGPLIPAPDSSVPLNRETAPGRAILDGRTCHLPDIASLDPVEFARARRLAAAQGFRAAVSAPLLRKGIAIGAVVLRKPEPGPFTPRQIELLENFAAQAVIAIENVRLFTELRDSLERLKAAQANLIQSEKMASLGQLTAGIAHEIKNPLNFVNNFAGLSVELLDELKEVAEPVLAGMSKDARAEFGETIEMITSNLDKIAEHGKRADGIVKSMLSHSRGGTGDWQESNINALVEEALNLAYHGARAQDKEFNVTLERDFAPITQPIELVPQDVTRVFLNLFGNGFYAANKRRLGGGEAGYRPTLKVSTRNLGEAVEITVRDNGIGIPPEVRAKLFQPFFTTKPTGEGTGLGLSISYDIVTQQHGGTIKVESEPGSFTEFTVRLPRGQRAARSRGT